MEMKPVRIQRSRKHKQVSPNGLPIVYVGRPSKWGNPFKVGKTMMLRIYKQGHCAPLEWVGSKEGLKKHVYGGLFKVMDLEKSLDLYEKYIVMMKRNNELNLSELKGKNLSCWCKIGEPCHADILLKLANEKQ